MTLDQHARQHLDDLQAHNLSRRLRSAETPLLNFASNDYLGFSTHPQLAAAAQRVLQKPRLGSGASRLICGHGPEHLQLEEALAAFKGTEAALTFSTGYAAAVGTIPALMGKNDVVVLDKLVHASLIDGARLSGATLRVYPHHHLDYLERLLQRHQGQNLLIVTESVFSMDGDTAPLHEIVALKEKYGAWLMVDEAHATGLYGKRRQGWIEVQAVSDQVEIQMGTLSKALGSAGGYITGSRSLIDLLINRARSLIFSTAPPPAISAASLAALELIQSPEGEKRVNQLWDHLRYFSKCLGRSTPPASPICPILLGSEAKALAAAETLHQKGFWVPAIRHPTVARGQARLRVTLSATHTTEQIDQLTHELRRLG